MRVVPSMAPCDRRCWKRWSAASWTSSSPTCRCRPARSITQPCSTIRTCSGFRPRARWRMASLPRILTGCRWSDRPASARSWASRRCCERKGSSRGSSIAPTAWRWCSRSWRPRRRRDRAPALRRRALPAHGRGRSQRAAPAARRRAVLAARAPNGPDRRELSVHRAAVVRRRSLTPHPRSRHAVVRAHRMTIAIPSIPWVLRGAPRGHEAAGTRRLDAEGLPDHLDRLYRAALMYTGSREDADDLVQETYPTSCAGRASSARTPTSPTCCGPSATPGCARSTSGA